MNNANSYGWETTEINYVAYLVGNRGYKLERINKTIDEKTKKPVITFVFYDSHRMIEADICDFVNSEISKFMRTRNELLSLVRQSNQISSEVFVEKANG
jgi:aspartyl/asparaginyl beta-hydroxylase (cupin superfamily)